MGGNTARMILSTYSPRELQGIITAGNAVLLKGGHSVGSCNDLLCADGEMIWISGERIVTNNTHGTGCTLSSAIASLLAQGMPLEKSVRSAKTYITQAIAAGLSLGHGNGPIAHNYRILPTERN